MEIERHNNIRGNTYDDIMKNINKATSNNICFYMAINKINNDTVKDVCYIAREIKNVRAVSFNFHTPYTDTKGLKYGLLKKLGFVIDNGENIVKTLKGAFYYHYHENFYTLSYIDKMWEIIRKEAFPKKIKFL